jgi:hypothetical protein
MHCVPPGHAIANHADIAVLRQESPGFAWGWNTEDYQGSFSTIRHLAKWRSTGTRPVDVGLALPGQYADTQEAVRILTNDAVSFYEFV